MIEGIQNLWSGILTIIDGIKMGIEFIINLVVSMFELVKLVFTTWQNTNTLIATLPPWLIAFATCSLGVAVLYLIVGRETGK